MKQDGVTSDCLVVDLCSISWNLALNLQTSAKMSGDRDRAALASETRTLWRGSLDMRNSSAARSDLSTILDGCTKIN